MIRAGVWLATAHVRAHPGRTMLLCLCIAVTVMIPLLTRFVTARYDEALRAATDPIPAVVGEKGSRFDLVFASTLFEPLPERSVPLMLLDTLLAEDRSAVPLIVRDTAGGVPVVGTSYEFFESYGLVPEHGRGLATLGDVVAGSVAADRLGVSPGDTIASDQRRSFDLTASPSVRLNIVGVLPRTRTPVDGVLLVDLETAWVLEGRSHAHDDAENITDDSLLLGEADGHIALSGAVIPEQSITEANAASFHHHGERRLLPLTAILLLDVDAKTATLLEARLRETTPYQLVRPKRVAAELLDRIVRAGGVLDAVALVVGAMTIALLAMITVLTYRIRRDEIRTLADIGCSRGTVAAMFLTETACVVLLGMLIGVVGARVFAPVAASAVSVIVPMQATTGDRP